MSAWVDEDCPGTWELPLTNRRRRCSQYGAYLECSVCRRLVAAWDWWLVGRHRSGEGNA
jgi:hypothetical protein